MDLQKIIEAFEELCFTEERAKKRIILTFSDKDKLLELAEAFKEAGCESEALIARRRYNALCGRETERLPRDVLFTEKGIRITLRNIKVHKIDFAEFAAAVNIKHFCLKPGCTTCGNMDYRNACRRIGKEGLIQLMLNTEEAEIIGWYKNSIYLWTINHLFPGAYAEYSERRESREFSK